MEIKELLALATEIRTAIQGYLAETTDYGEVLKRRPQDVTRKIDLLAEEAMHRALQRREHCARIISEELGDPIDGSTNVVMGIPVFCTSIAYSPKIEHVRFEDIQASVVAAIYGKTYCAVRGGYAWVDGTQLPRTIRGKTKRAFSVYTYGATSIPEAVLAFLTANGDKVIRVLGSVALELCLVAEGAIDGFLDLRGLINGYDIAGAALILQEAGGTLTDLEGRALDTEAGRTHNVSIIAALQDERYDELRALMHSSR
jgi:myo-inositol-1(or 4)-monophosphatase